MPTRFGLAAMGSSTVSASRSWLVNEDCEGTGTPAGWTNGTGTPNWDYSAVPLEGSQSLYLSIAAAAHRTFIDFGDRDEVYVYFLMRYTNGATPGGARTIAQIGTAGGFVNDLNFQYAATLKLSLGTTTPVTATAADTTYHVWLHYLKGTGADANQSVAFSTTGVRPTSGANFASITNGTSTFQMGRISFGTTTLNTSSDFIFDKIRVSDTLIGDNGA